MLLHLSTENDTISYFLVHVERNLRNVERDKYTFSEEIPVLLVLALIHAFRMERNPCRSLCRAKKERNFTVLNMESS